MDTVTPPVIDATAATAPTTTSRRRNVLLQVCGTLVTVVCLALVLTTVLNGLRFRETLEGLVAQRLEVVLQEVAGDVLVGLDLGLRLEAMENLGALITRHVHESEGVASLTIHDCAGKVLVAATADESTPRTTWTAHLGKPLWRHFDTRGMALGVMLNNSFGECVGGVAIDYAADGFFQTRDAVMQRLLQIALLAALLVLPATGLLAWYFSRRNRHLRQVRRDLEALANGHDAKRSMPAPGNQQDILSVYAAARPVLVETLSPGADAASPPDLVAQAPQPKTAAQPADRATAPQQEGRRWRRWQLVLDNPVRVALSLTTLTLLAVLVFASWFAAEMFRATLLPELAQKGRVESRQAAHSVQRALDLQIPLAELVGVTEFYASMRRNDADLAFLAITDRHGQVRHAAGVSAADLRPVLQVPAEPPAVQAAQALQYQQKGYLVSAQPLYDREQQLSGTLHLGHDDSALNRPIEENLADVAIVLMVSLFLAFELMLLVVTCNVTLPLRATLQVLRAVTTRQFALIHSKTEWAGDELGRIARQLDAAVRQSALRLGVVPQVFREPRLVGVRLLAFLFVFAEELARPVMPAYFGQLSASGGEGFVASMGAGSVMALHMAVVALAMPLGSALYAYIGRQRMYLAGALLAFAGLLGTGLAENLGQLLFWRAISGLGYAATFVACQGLVIESTGPRDRAQGTAMMVGGIMLADICGPAIGGILAAWIGHGATFMLGAGVALLSAVVLKLLMDPYRDHVETPPKLTWQAFGRTLANRRLMVLLLFAAVPAKLILSGWLFYLTPLALLEQGADTAQIGRILMLYGVAGVLTGPLLARLTDRYQRPVLAVFIGAALTALGSLPIFFWASELAVACGVLALGLGQSLAIPALVTSALKLSQSAVNTYGQGPVMAALRLLERLGGAAGPLLAALLASHYGVITAMGLFGLYALLSSLLLLLGLRLSDRRRHPRPAAAPAKPDSPLDTP